MKVICDIEANGLTPDIIFCVVCLDVETEKMYVFLEGDQEKFKAFATGVTGWIGHNFIDYDSYWLNRLWGTAIGIDSITDTLVLSRLFNRSWETDGKLKQARSKHGLAAWGESMGYPKIDFDDFTRSSQEMLDYCKRDVRLNYKVYQQLLCEGKDFSKQSVQLEHYQQWILSRQMRNGFKFDMPKAKALLATCTDRASEIEAEIQADFPPLPKMVKTYEPKLNKDGRTHNKASMGPLRDTYGFGYDGDPYTAINWVDFNLSSPTQVVKRIKDYWKPVEFTPKGNPKVSEKNLETVTADAPKSVKNLALYRMYTSRMSMLDQWIEGAEKYDDNRVRGRVIHIGSWSGRMAHQSPNTANIPGIKTINISKFARAQGCPIDRAFEILGLNETDYHIYYEDGDTCVKLLSERGGFGYECRELWTAGHGNVLVGTDASGIQLRVLAHYLNNEAYTKAVLTDIHTFNASILGCDRPTAKTFIYSWLLGAGVAKTASILGCSTAQAVKKRERFVQLTPGLQEFMNEKQATALRGYYRGLDGRICYVPSDHLALTAYLQQGEGAVMRMANVLWDKWARQRGIKFKQCAMVHDEFQAEVEEGREHELGELQVRSFQKAAELLKLNCPMDGEYNVGQNWAETH
jgi:DNA polymerase-1